MAQKAKRDDVAAALRIEEIKRLVIVGMFADDMLLNELVLKGGNAIDLIMKVTTRASVDVDFSMPGNLPANLDVMSKRIKSALTETFRLSNFALFDFKMEAKPEIVTEDLASFWGGYGIEFKLIELAKYEEFQSNVEALRQNAVGIGRGKKFLVDISNFEYTKGKEAATLDGYKIFVYSPAMIVCEKLRAICQQMPEYNEIVKRGRPGSARARDFIDIFILCENFDINLSQGESKELLAGMFRAKRVPLIWLKKIKDFRDFHRADWPNVIATAKPGQNLEEFDVYFDFVLKLVGDLKPFGDE